MHQQRESGLDSDGEQPADGVRKSRRTGPVDQSIWVSAIPKWLAPVAFFTAILFLAAILLLAVKVPTPAPFQFIVVRILIALFGAAFSMAITGCLTVRLHLSKEVQIVAGGALAVFIVLYFFSPGIPGVPKPEPLVDPQGHLLESPANPAELQVIRLQDEIMDLRQYKESVQYPDSRSKLKDAPYLAERILGFNDSSLNPRRRYIKYEYAAFAYVDAAAAAMFDDRPRVEEYASRVIKNANTALSMLDAADRAYQSDENSRFLLDWVAKDNGKDRVLYLRAEAECMLATVKNDANLKSQAFETWNQIDAPYREKLPAAGTPQLNGCVPK